MVRVRSLPAHITQVDPRCSVALCVRAGALVVGGLAWLAIMLQAYEAEGIGLSAFPRVYLIGLAQAYLIQDPVKVRLDAVLPGA